MTNKITFNTTKNQIFGVRYWLMTGLTFVVAFLLMLTMTAQTVSAQGQPCGDDCVGVQPDEILEAGDGDMLPELILTKQVFLPVVYGVDSTVTKAQVNVSNGGENPCTDDCAQVELEAGDGDLLPEFTSPVRVFLPAVFGK